MRRLQARRSSASYFIGTTSRLSGETPCVTDFYMINVFKSSVLSSPMYPIYTSHGRSRSSGRSSKSSLYSVYASDAASDATELLTPAVPGLLPGLLPPLVPGRLAPAVPGLEPKPPEVGGLLPSLSRLDLAGGGGMNVVAAGRVSSPVSASFCSSASLILSSRDAETWSKSSLLAINGASDGRLPLRGASDSSLRLGGGGMRAASSSTVSVLGAASRVIAGCVIAPEVEAAPSSLLRSGTSAAV